MDTPSAFWEPLCENLGDPLPPSPPIWICSNALYYILYFLSLHFSCTIMIIFIICSFVRNTHNNNKQRNKINLWKYRTVPIHFLYLIYLYRTPYDPLVAQTLPVTHIIYMTPKTPYSSYTLPVSASCNKQRTEIKLWKYRMRSIVYFFDHKSFYYSFQKWKLSRSFKMDRFYFTISHGPYTQVVYS